MAILAEKWSKANILLTYLLDIWIVVWLVTWEHITRGLLYELSSGWSPGNILHGVWYMNCRVAGHLGTYYTWFDIWIVVWLFTWEHITRGLIYELSCGWSPGNILHGVWYMNCRVAGHLGTYYTGFDIWIVVWLVTWEHITRGLIYELSCGWSPGNILHGVWERNEGLNINIFKWFKIRPIFLLII